jgi:hypothetical protein
MDANTRAKCLKKKRSEGCDKLLEGSFSVASLCAGSKLCEYTVRPLNSTLVQRPKRKPL